MQNISLKHLTVFILFALLAGCASTPPATSHANHQMDLEQAFRERGLYLNENSELTSLRGLCSDWKLDSEAGRNCMAESRNVIFSPTLPASKLTSSTSLARLVRALPKDADFTVLLLQKELLSQGLYKTWAGETQPYAQSEELQANQQKNQYQGFDGRLPASATGTLKIKQTKTPF